MGRVAWCYPASDGGLLVYLLELGGGGLGAGIYDTSDTG